VAASIGQVGKELASVHGVTTVPVRITGPFDNLSYQLDLANLATDVARSKLEAAVGQQLQKKVPPSLQDSLKGLLGR
jgi:AsmA protein